MTEQTDLESLREKTETGDRLDVDAVAPDEADQQESSSEEDAGDETAAADGEADAESKRDGAADFDAGDDAGLQTEGSSTSSSGQNEGRTEEKLDTEMLSEIDGILDDLDGNDPALHIWDEGLAALVVVLEDNPELEAAVVEELDERLETTVDGESQSQLLSAVLRVGFQEIVPELVDAVKEARKRRLLREL